MVMKRSSSARSLTLSSCNLNRPTASLAPLATTSRGVRDHVAEIVLFKLPAGMTRADFLRSASETIAYWRDNSELVRKTYIHDADRGYGGGLYLWPSVEVAERWHGDDFRDRIMSVYGGKATCTYYETSWVTDNRAYEFVDYASHGI